MTDNSRIAKNIVYLYIRMFFVMGVSLYTSRVVLSCLGVDDFALYGVIGGVVGLLSFLNNCAGAATSRYLTFSLGNESDYDYNDVFSIAFFIHLGIAVIILLLGETIGLWYVTHKMIIPIERKNVAMLVYQFSILTCFVTFTQVPYNASIIAHEKMGVFAFIGIYEAISKLIIAIALRFSNIDRLVLYSLLLFLLTFSISIFYRFYCLFKIGDSCKVQFKLKRVLLKELLSYSGWDLIGNLMASINNQGINLLLNLYFAPVVNAARSLAFTVENAVLSLTNNYQTAIRPSIIKTYANGELEEVINKASFLAKTSVYLFAFFAIPIIIEGKIVLTLWLKNVPEYTLEFVRLTLIIYLVVQVSQSLIIVVHASGDVKHLNLYSCVVSIVKFSFIFLCLKNNIDAYIIYYASIITAIVNVGINSYVVKRNINSFSILHFLLDIIISVIKVLLIPIVLSICLHILLNSFNPIIRMVIVFISYCLCELSCVWFIGLNSKMRQSVLTMISENFLGRKKND